MKITNAYPHGPIHINSSWFVVSLYLPSIIFNRSSNGDFLKAGYHVTFTGGTFWKTGFSTVSYRDAFWKMITGKKTHNE